MYKTTIFVRIAMCTLVLSTYALAQSDLLEGVVPYTPKKDQSFIYGSLNCRGSTNVGALLKKWVPAFQAFYPQVKSHLEFKGSGDGIRALINEEVNIGATSRPIRNSEILEFKQLKGYAPTEIKISLDALAIYVNRLNQLESISLDELDAIFSRTRNRGYPHAITDWEMLTESNGTINLYLYNRSSGTRYYFQDHVLLRGIYNRSNVVSEEYASTRKAVSQVAKDPNGICFGSVGINNFKVKTLSLSKRKHYPTYAPSPQSIKEGMYPLTRYFYIYMDVPPDKPIPTLLYEFCKFVLSKDGQQAVLRNGGIPLSPQQIGVELAKMRRE